MAKYKASMLSCLSNSFLRLFFLATRNISADETRNKANTLEMYRFARNSDCIITCKWTVPKRLNSTFNGMAANMIDVSNRTNNFERAGLAAMADSRHIPECTSRVTAIWSIHTTGSEDNQKYVYEIGKAPLNPAVRETATTDRTTAQPRYNVNIG